MSQEEEDVTKNEEDDAIQTPLKENLEEYEFATLIEECGSLTQHEFSSKVQGSKRTFSIHQQSHNNRY